ncbi:MAG: hydroxymethylglutaryl-CoA lyase, partial [Flavobacteriales bacterium]|nr:hydroxymethylglutaryl-CoA lyase [Flavobacteriales bacterium]
DAWEEKVAAAYLNGCRRFDAALNGFGGCPMAKDDLVGNMPTEKLITYFNEDLGLNPLEMEKSLGLISSIF